MLDTQVVSNNAVDPRATIIELVVGKHDEHGILSLLALDEYRVSAKQVEVLHGLIRQTYDRVVIVRGICDSAAKVSKASIWKGVGPHIREFGFFFFFRIAVAVSFS